VRRRGDRYTGDAVVAQHGVEFCDPSVVPIGVLKRGVVIRIADRSQGAELGKVADQVFAPIAATDRRHLHRAVPVSADRHNVVCQFISPMLPQSG